MSAFAVAGIADPSASVAKRQGLHENGLWEIREVGLVPSSPAPEVCPAEHALTIKNKDKNMNKETDMDKNKERDMEHRKAHLAMAVAVGVLLALTGISAASASDPTAEGCAEQFELAQRTDMESFRDYDRETFRGGHDPRAGTVFASGAVRYGIDAIMRALEPHFANREAICARTELYRVVDGCKSAFILYDATYDIPSIGYHQRTLTGVTYTHDGNRWLSIADQGTYLEAP